MCKLLSVQKPVLAVLFILVVCHLAFFLYGFSVDKSFRGFDVVLGSGCPEAINAECVVVCCGWSGFTFVVASFGFLVADNVFAVGAPMSRSAAQIADDGELELVFVQRMSAIKRVLHVPVCLLVRWL